MRRIFGFAETKSNDENMQLFAHLNLRLHLLHYQYAMQTQDLELANSLLKKVKLILSKLPNKMGEMYLSNQKHFNHINIDVIKKEESMVDCHLLVKDVENYYANEQYDAVIPVLLKFRKNSFESPELSKMVQVEVLLESFWMTNQYVKCMKLAEETLYNNIETWMWRDANDRNVSKKIRYHIKFILIYLKDLLQDDYQCKYALHKFSMAKRFLIEFFCFFQWLHSSTKRIDCCNRLLNCWKFNFPQSMLCGKEACSKVMIYFKSFIVF